jgi:hypothetical protein
VLSMSTETTTTASKSFIVFWRVISWVRSASFRFVSFGTKAGQETLVLAMIDRPTVGCFHSQCATLSSRLAGIAPIASHSLMSYVTDHLI